MQKSSHSDPADGLGETPHRVGDRVRVRRQPWRIVDLRLCQGCQLFTLSGTGASNNGTMRHVLVPFDIVEPLNQAGRLKLVTMRRWRRACVTLLAARGTTGALRCAAAAKIDILPHQLEPALALVRGLGTSLLIADEVGLGKTIQAGLVVSELQARGAADRVLVLTPAGLCEQWASELGQRFGMNAAILDTHEATRRAAELPIGLNPWLTVPIAIASIDYVKRREVLPAVRACRWDAIVIDEAHHLTPGSDRDAAVRALCSATPYVILLTATPHSGDRRAFLSLCNLGARRGDHMLVFRRSRRDVMLGAGRHVHRVLISACDTELQMHSALARVTRAVRSERRELDREVRLVLTILQKRALSSAFSLERSAVRRLDSVPEVARAVQQFSLPLDDDGDLNPADESPLWNTPLFDDRAVERQMLMLLRDGAREVGTRETKLARLRTLLARLGRMGEPAIVFTEYRDTLLHVYDALSLDCAVIHGGMNRAERRAAVDSFTSGRHSLLLTTDAASEGLNLHHTCRVVINLELPWNPMRLEQRIGRVDRIGQTRTVHAFHLIARDTVEMRILERLQQRIADAQAMIGTPDPLGLHGGDVVDDVDDLDDVASTPLNPPIPASLAGAVDTVSADHVALTRLKDEAASEQARLVFIRSLMTARQPIADPMPAGVLAAFCRRRGLRRFLSSRILALVQTELEDALGRVVAAHLTPLAVATTRAISSGELEGLLRTLGHTPLERIDSEFIPWKAESSRVHAAFWAARLWRERDIAGAFDEQPRSRFQAGLFDRRADHERAIEADVEQASNEEAQRRIAAAEAARIDIRATSAIILLMS